MTLTSRQWAQLCVTLAVVAAPVLGVLVSPQPPKVGPGASHAPASAILEPKP